MAWFKRSDKVLDLTEGLGYERAAAKRKNNSGSSLTPSQTTTINSSTQTDSSAGGFFGSFFGGESPNSASANSSSFSSVSSTLDNEGSPEETRRKLAKRLGDMTDKMEDLSNQIYRMQQRIEVLEKKSGIGSSENYGY